MPNDEPSPAEIMRRLDDVVKRFEDVSKDVREFRNWAERLYVPRGEWVEGRRADQAATKEIAEDVSELKASKQADLAYRRQFTIALIGVALSSFGALAVAIILLVLSGGHS